MICLKALARVAILFAFGGAITGQSFSQTLAVRPPQEEVEEYRQYFQFMTASQIQELRGEIASGLRLAESCEPARDCPVPTCGMHRRSVLRASQISGGLTALNDALTHLHSLSADHLGSLQSEAVLAEDEFHARAGVVLLQRYIFYIGSTALSLATFSADFAPLTGAAGSANMSPEEALLLLNAADESYGDLRSAVESFQSTRASLPAEVRGQISPPRLLNAELARLKSDIDNLRSLALDMAGGNSPLAPGTARNVLLIAGRHFQAAAEQEIARRQAELDHLGREAHRERMEVAQFFQRTHALTVQSWLVTQAIDEANQLAAALRSCGARTCDLSNLAGSDVPDVFETDPEDPGRRLLDPVALRQVVARLIVPAGGVRFEAYPDRLCGDRVVGLNEIPIVEVPQMPELERAVIPLNPVIPPVPGCGAAPNYCNLLDDGLRQQCEAGSGDVAVACAEMVQANLGLHSVGFPIPPELARRQCEAECRYQYTLDAYLEYQRRLSLQQVELYARSNPRWAGQAGDYWSRFDADQPLQCGGLDVLGERLSACVTHCSTSSTSPGYEECLRSPMLWPSDLSSRLMPPGLERRGGADAD